MDINCTEDELLIFKKIAEAGAELNMPVYIIGGFVRDKILDRPTKDADIVCIGDGIELAGKTAEKFSPTPTRKFFQKFRHSPNKNFIPKNPILKSNLLAHGKKVITTTAVSRMCFPASLDEDRMRRDFTINTMAISLNKNDFGKLIDPLNGRADLEEKIIKTPLPPGQTFIDDPLRMMRAIRFATQLNFTIFPETFEAIRENAARIKIVSGERIIDEINKIIMTPKPSVGFDLLYKSGLLKIIFPQMVALVGAEYIDGKGHKDNFYHTLQVLDNIAPGTRMIYGFAGPPFCMTLPNPLPKNLKKAMAGHFTGMKSWVGEWFLKSSRN